MVRVLLTEPEYDALARHADEQANGSLSAAGRELITEGLK